MEPLFVDPRLVFEKDASAEAPLPEDPNTWKNEILQEFYKQVPYAADFDPDIEMTKIDAERSYGFGHVLLGNKTELPPGSSKDTLEAAGVKQVRIPIIVREGNLQPFDLLITSEGKALPLTETRLREALFRPQSFDMTAKRPGDTSLMSQLYPPVRNNFGGGLSSGTMGDSAGAGVGMLGKLSSSPLDCALSGVNVGDFDDFLATIGTPEMQAAYATNTHAVAPALKKIAATHPISVEKRASVLPHLLPVVVAQITKDAEGYTLKTANPALWAPVVQRIDRGELVQRFGEKVALATDVAGSTTLANDTEAPEPEKQDELELIKDFGIYKVHDVQGRELVGYVFPNLLDLDGMKLPEALFTNGSQYALQGEIVGARIGDAIPIHEGRPRGLGCFFTLEEGEASATMPLTIRAGFTGENEAGLMAETFDGRQLLVSQLPNVQQIMLVDDTMLVPDTFKWLSLEGAEKVVLASDPDDVVKESQARASLVTVYIRGDGSSFSLSGEPVEKIAEDQRSFLSVDDALFLLGGLGVDLHHAQRKLAHASLGERPIPVRIGRFLKVAEDVHHQARQHAERWLAQVPDLRRPLFKEAAVIPDPVAVDTVLSLGFLNPENLISMVKCLPQIEEAQRRLCELLLASRLGLKEIPTTALETAIRSVEEVLAGLKVIAFQKN